MEVYTPFLVVLVLLWYFEFDCFNFLSISFSNVKFRNARSKLFLYLGENALVKGSSGSVLMLSPFNLLVYIYLSRDAASFSIYNFSLILLRIIPWFLI